MSGTNAANRNASAHDVPDTVAANTIGATIAMPDSTDCWKPIAAPLRAGPASSAAVVNARAFQPIDSPPATASAGTSSHNGTAGEQRDHSETHGHNDPDLPQRADARADDVRPATGPDPDPDREHLRRGDHQRGVAFGEPVLVVEEHDAEPDDRDLRVDVDAAAECEAPEAAVSKRPRERRRLELVLRAGAAADDDGTDDRAQGTQRREEKEPGRGIARRDELGHDEGSDEPAERHGRLPYAERKTALLGTEPVHHRAAARRVDTRTGTTGEREQHDERLEVRRVCRTDEEPRTPAETKPENDSFAEPVRRDPPREHRHERPHPLRRKQHADLREREVVLLAERRHEHGKPDRERGEARLRQRPGGEHRPPVAPARYSPKGLIGRAPVETITLFVSRYKSSVSSPSSRPKPDCL